jgi:purine nucleoside permease
MNFADIKNASLPAMCSHRRNAALASLLLALAACGSSNDDNNAAVPAVTPARLAPKVVVINMFGGEAAPFKEPLNLTRKVTVKGLSSRYPDVLCNTDDVCQVTTDMGYANAAASISALLYNSRLDLRQTYFIIAGIAGINPKLGTVGSAAWARYAVDYSIAHEIDAREIPAGWPYGYFGVGAASPTEKPAFDYQTEVFKLNAALADRAYALSKSVQLSDSAEAQAFRARYPQAPANQPPAVIQCDTVSGDTWFAGATLANRAEDWSRLLTDGAAAYCTTQQEDNSTLEALRRGAAAGRVDIDRVMIVRSGSDMDRPYPGQSNSDVVVNYAEQGGFVPATKNLQLTTAPVIREIVANWSAWSKGLPAQ